VFLRLQKFVVGFYSVDDLGTPEGTTLLVPKAVIVPFFLSGLPNHSAITFLWVIVSEEQAAQVLTNFC
jgi:hypothetical protein